MSATETEITLDEMLRAREERAERITAARTAHTGPLLSFSMNIPGPVKRTPLICRGFRLGLKRLEEALVRAKFPHFLLDCREAATGCEALLAVRAGARELKALAVRLEDADEVGRLFDMDVLDEAGCHLERGALGHPQRCCMVCGAAGRGCASRRVHSAEVLRAETDRRLTAHFAGEDAAAIARLAAESLVAEVNVTPKPGLVDRANTGSHSDMDVPLFYRSAEALLPYWADCVRTGQATAHDAPEETFAALRPLGLAAERAMLTATGGVNTHKGAIFLLGTVCAAVGRLWDAAAPCRDAERILAECARMTAAPMAAELRAMESRPASTAGERLYRELGLTGARGEIMAGLPGVRDTALPVLRRLTAQGLGEERAAAIALLHLIARGTDTNMAHRGGIEGAAWGAEAARALLRREPEPSAAAITALDETFISRRLSPGGCADLLAIALFLLWWEQGMERW